MAVKAIPEGYYSLTPYLVCKGAAKAIDYYTKVFGAQETVRMPGPGGHVMHAELKIGNSMLMLSDENKERGYLSPETIGGTATSIMLYTTSGRGVQPRHRAAKSRRFRDMFVANRWDRLESVRPQWAIARTRKIFSGRWRRMHAVETRLEEAAAGAPTALP